MDIGLIIQKIVILAPPFLFALTFHELAHGYVAWRLGDPTAKNEGRLTMNPLKHLDPWGVVAFIIMKIGWAKPVPVNSANLRNPLVHNAYVAAAGPASNFILAFLGAVLWIIARLIYQSIPGLREAGEPTILFFDTLCRSLIIYNTILAVFNLIPIPPLDGHWILIRFLPPGPREAVASVGRFGFIILIGLLWTGALWFIIGPPFRLIVNGYFGLVNTALRLL